MGALVAVCDHLTALIEANKTVAASPDFPITQVFYGDQEQISSSVVVCIDPGEKTASTVYGSRKVEYDLTHFIMVYARTQGSVQSNRRLCDVVSEHIEDLINADPKLGGLVIQSHVSNVRPGYTQRSNSIIRSTRLTITSTITAILPQLGG